MNNKENVQRVDFNNTQNSIISKYKDSMIELDQPGKYLIPKMLLQDFLALGDHAIERPYHKRLRKMKKHFEKNLKTLTDVSAMVATCDMGGLFQGNPVEVSAYQESKVDAHTRALDWKQKLAKGEAVPEFVSCTVYYVDSFDEYCNIYYSFDSADSAEKTAEKIAGTFDVLGINVTSNVARSGNFATALNTAYPGDPDDAILNKVAYFKKEIELLDETKVFGSKVGCQPVYAACLQQGKIHSTPVKSLARITSFFTQLGQFKKPSSTTSDTGKFYGPDLLAYVYLMQDKHDNEGQEHKCKVNPAFLKKTSYLSLPPQLDFISYCFDIFMNKDPKKIIGGVKRPQFTKRWDAAEVTLLATHPISNIDVTDEDYSIIESVGEGIVE